MLESATPLVSKAYIFSVAVAVEIANILLPAGPAKDVILQQCKSIYQLDVYVDYNGSRYTPLQHSENKDYPVHGLLNLGTNCYINAALACFSQVPNIDQLIKKEQSTGGPQPFLDVYRRIKAAQAEKDENGIRDGLGSLLQITKDWCFGEERCDARDFLLRALDHTAPLQALFNIPLQVSTECTRCNMQLKTSRCTKNVLSLSLQKVSNNPAASLQELVNEWFKPKKVSTKCPRCLSNAVPVATTKVKIDKHPSFLLIACTSKKKLNLQFPVDKLRLPSAPLGQDYGLRGVILHAGTPHGGHYVACVKNNDQWYVCDDAYVEQLDTHDRNKNIETIAHTGRHGSFFPCVFLYQRMSAGAAPARIESPRVMRDPVREPIHVTWDTPRVQPANKNVCAKI